MDRVEAIEIVRNTIPYNSFPKVCEALKTLIPELKESEDERIRKELLAFLKENLEKGGNAEETWDSKGLERWISWLEKQGEKKIVNINDIKEKAHKIAWETSKHYDPNSCKQEWCEMAALDMALWLEKGITTR